MEYYIDSCVWLNIFNKNEANSNSAITSKELIEKLLFSKKDNIIYSGFVLRELEYKLKEYYPKKREWFLKEPKIKFFKANEKTYSIAREIEKETKPHISFFDCLHIALCKENNIILITRDKQLLQVSKKHIISLTPENALQRVNFV